jgi:hypothetical protein
MDNVQISFKKATEYVYGRTNISAYYGIRSGGDIIITYIEHLHLSLRNEKMRNNLNYLK